VQKIALCQPAFQHQPGAMTSSRELPSPMVSKPQALSCGQKMNILKGHIGVDETSGIPNVQNMTRTCGNPWSVKLTQTHMDANVWQLQATKFFDHSFPLQ